MNFCGECGFKFYVTEIDRKLMNLCKNCGHVEENLDKIIEVRKLKDEAVEYVNTDIVDDPTYARTKQKTCPNPDCETRKSPELQEAVFFESKKTMKVIYVCRTCRTQWSY